MAYIGKLPATQGKDAGPALKIDDISGDFDGLTKVFDLKVNEESVDPHINNISIFLSGVHQVPGDSFSLSGSRIVFSAAPSASLDFHGAILGATRILVPDNATVETRAFTNDTIVSISGSLGANASTIRTLSSTTISGSFTAPSSSLASRITTAESELGNTLISSSAQIAQDISGSRDATSISGSRDAASISGSLGANASTIRTLSASTVSGSRDAASISGSLGANASTIRTLSSTTVSGSFGNQRVGTADNVKFNNITGSNNISASGNLSVTGNVDVDGTSNFAGNVTMQNDLSVTGRINAEEIHTTFVSASITTTTGSNVFGDATTDSHQFTGSVDISGSLQVSDGNVVISDTLTATNIGAFTAAGAIDFSNENMTNVDIDSGNIDAVTFGSTLQSMISGSRDVASISGSFGNQRVGTTDDVEFANITGSNVSASGLAIFNNNVGIGTNSPSNSLHLDFNDDSDVFTAARISDNSVSGILINNTDTGNGHGGMIKFSNRDGENHTAIAHSQDGNTDASLLFYTMDGGTLAEVMRVDHTHRVGIGDGSPGSPLDVKSSEAANTANFNSTNGATNITFESNGSLIGQMEFSSAGPSQIVTRTTASLALGSNNVQSLFITDDDLVGIGTSSPAEELHVDKDQNGLTRIKLENQTNGSSAQVQSNYVTNAGEFNVGLTSTAHSLSGAAIVLNTANTDMFIGTNNTERMRIKADGNVGIGTSAPSGALHINGANPTVFITNSTQDGASTLLRLTEKKEVDGNAGGYLLYNGSQNRFEIGTNISDTDTNHITLKRDGSGFTGIGELDPSAPLEVANGSGAGQGSIGYNGVLIAASSASAQAYDDSNSATWGPKVSISNETASSTTTAASLVFAHRNSSSGVAAIVSTNAATDRADLRFITRGAGNAIAERVRIDNDGRMGIGCDDPEATLQVNTGVSDATIAAIDVGYGIEFNGGSGGHVGMGVIDGSSGRGKNRGFIGFRGNSASSMGHSHIVFGTANGVADDPSERMRITTAGKVGIGTDGPAARLHVEDANSNAPLVQFEFTGGGGKIVAFVTNGTENGDITEAAGGINYNSNSDYRLKENEVPLSDGLERLNKLKPYIFNFKSNKDTKVDGFFAHEVQEIVPNVISGEKDAINDDGSIKAQKIDLAKLVPLLVAAVQELSQKNEALEKRIKELEK